MRSLFLILPLAVLLQACGLRGPLYLPTPEEQREQAERRQRLEERERAEQNKPPAPESMEPSVQRAPPPPAPERTRPGEPPAIKPQPPPSQ